MVVMNAHPAAWTWKFWVGLACLVIIVSSAIPDYIRYRQDAKDQAFIANYNVRAQLFDPRSIYVKDVDYGKPVEMVVDRTIHAEFSADWFVRVRDYQSKQVVCEATGGGQYLPDAEMPSPVTLEWWAYTEPRCAGPNLQPGTYVVETTWRVDPPDPRLPVVSLSVRSNPFQVLPLDVPAETVDRYRGVQQQIEMLQEEIKQMKGDDE